MREIRQSGSVRGVRRNPYPYRDSVQGAIRALLFLLEDSPANLIVCIDLQQVHAPRGALASRQDQAADAVIKRIGILALTHSNPRMSCKIPALPASSVDSLPLVDYA
jgi:hypothetical protein